MSYHEAELTEKGRKALEETDFSGIEGMPIRTFAALMSVLAMAKNGLSLTEMTEEFHSSVRSQGSQMDYQTADNLIESLVNVLVSKGYLRMVSDRPEEEPPSAFSDFKDHF